MTADASPPRKRGNRTPRQPFRSDDADGAAARDSAQDAAQASRQRAEIAEIAQQIARRLDFQTVAQRIVDAVIEVTDFRVATVTLREGARCRRVATAGLEDSRIGLVTPFEEWAPLLQPRYRRGRISYLVPPDAPARWADIPDIPPSDDPDAWTAGHGLIVTLLDPDDQLVGFVAADEPRSGRLPDDATIETLEIFARQAQVAFANAHLYEVAQRQAQTMTTLFEVAKTMATTSDLQQIVPGLAAAVWNRMDALSVMVARPVPGGLELWRIDRGEPPYIDRVAAPLPLFPEGLAHRRMVVDDVRERPELLSWTSPGTRALVMAGGGNTELSVVLAVSSERPGTFSADDAEFVTGLRDIAAVAIRNADLYEEVRAAAERDALTGLRNRRLFWLVLEEALDAATRDQPLTLAIVDIDDFKAVNDQHGHDVGDRALVHVAGRLEGGIRETDRAFRVGGEEFVLVMPDTAVTQARAVLGRITEAIKRSRMDLPPLSVSVGLAAAPAHAVTAEELFIVADTALYRAKRGGKDRVEAAE